MFVTSEEVVVLDDLNRLVEWTQAWYDGARAGEFVEDPYQPDAELLGRLHQYFRYGLTPEEAVQVCFGMKH
jgi:hypothetical protein